MKNTLKILLASIFLLPSFAFAQVSLIAGGTGWGTSTPGDLLVGTSSVLRYSKLHIGASSTCLLSNGTVPIWGSTCGSGGGGGSGNSAWTIGLGAIWNATTSDDVGIGTTTPGTPLTVTGGIDFDNGSLTSTNSHDNTGGTSWGYNPFGDNGYGIYTNGNIPFDIGVDSLDAINIVHSLSISNFSNVGIDMQNSSYPLTVNGNVFAEDQGTAAGGLFLSYYNFFGDGSFDTFTSGNKNFELGASDTPELTLNPNGNVGIASTTPSKPLTVNGDSWLGGNVTATGTLSVTKQTTLSTASSTGLTVTATSTLSGVKLTNLTSTVLAVDTSGNVIGTTTGSGTVNNGTAGQVGAYNSTGTTISGTSTISIAGNATTSTTTIINILAATGSEVVGNAANPIVVLAGTSTNGTSATGGAAVFGIGTSTPVNPLVVASSTGANDFTIDTNGHIHLGGIKPSASCASTCTLDANARDAGGAIMISGVQTSVTLTFSSSYNDVVCTVSDNSSAGFYQPTSTTTTSVVFSTSASLGTAVIFYNCHDQI